MATAPPVVPALPTPTPDRFGGEEFDTQMQAWLSAFPGWTAKANELATWSNTTATDVALLTASATDAAITATTKAGQAAASAGAAQTYSDTALGYRNEANAHKNAAAGSATAANNSAVIASTKADEAAASAASIADGPVASWNGLTGIITQSQVYTTVRSAVLTGLSTATATAVEATDSLIVAIGRLVAGLALKANLESPSFTGVPAAPTAAASTNNTQLANTAFVKSQFVTGANGNGAYFLAPGLQICRNTLAIAAGGTATWTFPLTYGSSPQVFCTPAVPGDAVVSAIWISDVSATGCSFYSPNSAATGLNVLAVI